MNLNQNNKNSYSLLPLEEKILSNTQSQKQIANYLPTIYKLSVVILRKRLFIKSIIDTFQYIRMFLFGLLMKSYTLKDSQHLLQKIKRIVYGGSQFQQSHLKASQLVQKINSVPFNQGIETQNAVLDLFVQPLDHEILQPFIQRLKNQNVNLQNIRHCKDWFQDFFGQKFTVSPKYQSSERNLFFIEDNNTILYESQKDIQNLQGVSLSSNMLATSEMLIATTQSKRQTNKQNDLMELSLIKPSLHGASQSSPSPMLRHKMSQDSNYSPNPSPFQYSESKNKKPKSSGFNIWDYLCC